MMLVHLGAEAEHARLLDLRDVREPPTSSNYDARFLNP